MLPPSDTYNYTLILKKIKWLRQSFFGCNTSNPGKKESTSLAEVLFQAINDVFKTLCVYRFFFGQKVLFNCFNYRIDFFRIRALSPHNKFISSAKVTEGEECNADRDCGFFSNLAQNVSFNDCIFKGSVRFIKIILIFQIPIRRFCARFEESTTGREHIIFQALFLITCVIQKVLCGKSPQIKQRKFFVTEAEVFTIKAQYAYTEDMKEFQPAALSIVKPFRLLENYAGRENEVRFIQFLESNPTCIEWWFKNGTGKDALGIRYTDHATNKVRIFYPDWIIKFRGQDKLGIFDTKGGFTANESEVKDKAESLTAKIASLNSNKQKRYIYVGGIVIQQEGLWLYNDEQHYSNYAANKSIWKNFPDLFR